MFKSIVNLCQILDNKKQFKQSDKLFNMFKKATTEDEGKTIEEMMEELKSSIQDLDVKQVELPVSRKQEETEKYTIDDMPKLLELRQQILDLINEFKTAMRSGNEDFYEDPLNYKKYTDLRNLHTKMNSEISSDLSKKKRVNPIITPQTDAEFEAYNRMNPDTTKFYNDEMKFIDACHRFENDLSLKTPLIMDFNKIRPASTMMVVEFDPSLLELGLKQANILSRRRIEANDYFFLVDTAKGQRVYSLPSGIQFVINEKGFYDLPPSMKIERREDGSLRFRYL